MAIPIPIGGCADDTHATEGKKMDEDVLKLLAEVLRKATGTTVDPQILLGAQQNFASCQAVLQQTMTRFNDNSGFVAAESKQGFLLQEKVIGAAMIQLLEQEGLANLITQLKSAGSFPPNTNAGALGSA